ncbi:hypothetical protein AAZX31_04G098900 [Glycine max]
MLIWYLIYWIVDKTSLFKKSKSPFIYILDWKEAARNLLLFYITMNYHSYSNVKLVRTTQSIRPKMSRFESHAIDNLAGRPTEKNFNLQDQGEGNCFIFFIWEGSWYWIYNKQGQLDKGTQPIYMKGIQVTREKERQHAFTFST